MDHTDGELTLHQAAAVLGVHYMTVYRSVRTGVLPAHRVGSEWRVLAADAHAALAVSATVVRGRQPAGTRPGGARWSGRFASRLLSGDSAGALQVAEAAMAAGASLEELYVDIVAPALRDIGRQWEDGTIDVGHEHRASVITSRVLARIGARFTRRGRSKGAVVLGAAPGDRHGLPVMLLADLLQADGFDAVDLGADVPAASFAVAAASTQRLVAVGITVTTHGLDRSVRAAAAAIRAAAPGVALLIGGGAVRDEAHAESLGGDGWAADARQAVALTHRLSRLT